MTPARLAQQRAAAVDEPRTGGAHVAQRAGLAVVGRAELERRRLRRRCRAIFTLAALIVAGALLVVAAGQAFVAAQQVRLDRLEQQLATSVAKDQNLQLTRAQLESPSRILALAEHELGMVVPKSVTYLVPVEPSRTGAPAASRSAT
jgi:RNase P protein component